MTANVTVVLGCGHTRSVFKVRSSRTCRECGSRKPVIEVVYKGEPMTRDEYQARVVQPRIDGRVPPTSRHIGLALRTVIENPHRTSSELGALIRRQWAQHDLEIPRGTNPQYAIKILKRRGYIEEVVVDHRRRLNGWVVTQKVEAQSAEQAQRRQAARDRRTATPLAEPERPPT